jgi:hypothetical protein
VINWTVVIVDVEEHDDGEALNATTTFTASSSSTTCCRAEPDRLDALDLESAIQCAPSILSRQM